MTSQGPGGRDEGREERYLWDPRAEPEPAVARMEEALRPARLKAGVPEGDRLRASSAGGLGLRGWAGIAASLVVVAAVAWGVAQARRPSWEVVALAGAPVVDSSAVAEVSRLKRGEWLETDASSRASVTVSSIGTVTVEPESRVRLVNTREGKEHRLELAQGMIRASIFAPPRLFLVDTPSARAIDLGCVYSLAVGADGSSELRTVSGLVELAGRGAGGEVISRVPSGAVCRTAVGRGPGTPRFEDAPPVLVAALDRFDAGSGAGVDEVVAAARARDTLSLWHLLARTASAPERSRLIAAMAGAAGRPEGVTDADTSALTAESLEAWWTHLSARW